MAELSAGLPADAVQSALQRQVEKNAPIQAPARPQSVGDWVTVMRAHAQGVEHKNSTVGLSSREVATLSTLQRQTAQVLAQSVKTDPRPAVQRQASFAEHAAPLHGHPLTHNIPRAAIGFAVPSERAGLQRALDEALQRREEEKAQDARALQLHSLQRQMAELDAQATQPVYERIQQRRGAGNPLPEAIQRHLEHGLNHDLSAVRIHDDAEADKLSKKVNAVAFTTGTDIYFQSGKFNPNSQSGLELLAHEVTHTVQQSKGQVGKGIDPDAGLESEARDTGKRISQLPLKKYASRNPKRNAGMQTNHLSGRLAIQRVGAAMYMPASRANVFQGPKQQWDDAGAAAKLAIQALPARLAQHYKGMPAQLSSGLLAMLRDTVLILGATTALGAAIGSFFGGIGALPGAEIGFEIGNGVLMVWGLGSVVGTIAKQTSTLVQSMQSYLSWVKKAKGNPQSIKAASEALIGGLIIFTDALILAVAALGLKKLANTRIGQQIGATAATSPSMRWLAERQSMNSTRAALERTGSGGGAGGANGPALAGAAVGTANEARMAPPQTTPQARPQNTPQPTSQPRMEMSNTAAGAVSGGRIRTPIKGLYEGIDIANPPKGWKFKQEFSSNANGSNLKITVTGPNGQTGMFERAYDPAKHQLIMKNAFGKDLPTWVDTSGTPMVTGKGIPTNAFMTMYEMRRMGITYGSLKTVKMSTIQNMQAVLELESLRRKGIPIDEAILRTHSVQYAESSLIQSGHEVVGAKVILNNKAETAEIGDYMRHYERGDPRLISEHDRLLQQFNMSRSDKMPYKLRYRANSQTSTPWS